MPTPITASTLSALLSAALAQKPTSMFFDKYEPVPKNVQEKVLSDHKK